MQRNPVWMAHLVGRMHEASWVFPFYRRGRSQSIKRSFGGGVNMSEKEKRIAEKLAAVCEQLPDGKKEFLMGYAEGVAAMAKPKRKKRGEKIQQQGPDMVPGPVEEKKNDG